MIRKLLQTTTKASFVLAGLAFAAVPLAASAANTTVNVDVAGVISTFTTSGTVTLGALTPDATGRQSTNTDVVTVSTNDGDGFTLTLQDADATRTLVSGGNSFAASAGTPAVPITLVNNAWGWRVDGLSSFGAGPGAVISNAVPSALTYAGIPANASPFTLATTAAPGSDVTDVWYSARANDTQPTGTYTDIVTYTATVN
ncbi:MAG TPA: hypothetical protein VK674_05480 [Candidatus Limnocylindria bacterium]|nr:hypothetical protein [Candidatus Limnocylindria bacterium]